jgi:benzoate-CoA ligase family protein
MSDFTVNVDRSKNPAEITFAPVFNLAVPMVDRHLDEGRGGKVAIRTVNGDVTYAELAERVNRCGNALLDNGLKPGQRMPMIVKDCPEFIYLFYGAVKAGIVPIPLNTLLRTPDYQYIIEDSGGAGLAYSPEYAGEVEPALAAMAKKPSLIFKTEGTGGLGEMMEKASATLDPAPSTADGECFWLYSSGSTGRPKGAVHHQRDALVNAEYYGVGITGIDENDTVFSAAKLFFAYGLGNAMNFPLWVGATTVLSDRIPSPAMTFEMIEQFRPTIYFGVPTLYAAQLRALETATPDLSSLRLTISAGETLPADIYRRWIKRTGVTVLDGWGSTECTHIVISNRRDDHRPGSSGQAVPGYEARLVGDDGKDVPDGEIGRLMIRGRSICVQYWNQPEKTAATIKGEWIDTGDTYIRDADGWFTYCGRSDDMIKVGGIWCSPAEIEARLIEHPSVLEAAVVGRADDDELTKPEAYIILNDPSDASDELSAALLDHCKSGLARYKYPRWIHFVEDLPKTATGKIQRFQLRQS